MKQSILSENKSQVTYEQNNINKSDFIDKFTITEKSFFKNKNEKTLKFVKHLN